MLLLSCSPASSWYLILVALKCEKIECFSYVDLPAIIFALWFLVFWVHFLQLGYVRSMSFISYQEWAATVTLNVTRKTKSRRMPPLPRRGLTMPSLSSPQAKVELTVSPHPKHSREPARSSSYTECCKSRDCWWCCRAIQAQASTNKIRNSSLGILIRNRSEQERGTLSSLEKSV